MNELECKECGTLTECSEDAVSVTCSDCIMENILNLVTENCEVGIA